MRSARFEPRGLLALPRGAFGLVFEVPEEPQVENRNGVTVLHVRGPLMHHPEAFFDSYDSIRERLAAALASSPKAVVLAIDSPGGLVSGCFETAAALRSMAGKAGVPLYAYVNGQATSAAYALACASSKIVAPKTAMVGSVGVIDALVDATAQNAMFGVSVRLVTSGARKADGNPAAPITDEAVAAAQGRVDYLAEFFAEWVAETRGIAADQVLAMQAGVFPAAQAVGLRLVDETGDLDSLLASLAGGQPAEPSEATAEGALMATYTEAVEALRKAAEGDDEEAKAARRMLAAMDEDEKKDEPDGGEGKAEKAEDGPPPEPEKKDDSSEDAKAAAAKAVATADRALASAERIERRMLLASRPDIDAELRIELEKDSTPLATVRNLVSALPRKAAPKAAATAAVPATRGESQGAAEVSRLSPQAKAELDARMGLSTVKPGVIVQGNKLVLGAPVPVTEKGA